ncbi:MAG: DUF433 domain-containing protein [Acidobacteriota bacterium]
MIELGERMKDYISQVDGVYRISGTRVSLDSIIYLFREGLSVESMVESYPSLSMEQVHGALAFYLANQPRIDRYLAEGKQAVEEERSTANASNSSLVAKLRRALHEHQIPG